MELLSQTRITGFTAADDTNVKVSSACATKLSYLPDEIWEQPTVHPHNFRGVNEHNDLRLCAIRRLPLLLVLKIKSANGKNIETKKILKNLCQWIKVVNLLKPNGYVMHEQFNIQQLYVLPTLYLCVLYLSQNIQLLLTYITPTDWFL